MIFRSANAKSSHSSGEAVDVSELLDIVASSAGDLDISDIFAVQD